MSLFTDYEEIDELVSKLGARIRWAYNEITRSDAEEIADELINEKGLDYVCSDIDEAISEVEDWIHEDADAHVTYTIDNYLLATFDPYPENQEVEYDLVKPFACESEAEDVVDKAVLAYAYELWRIGIRNKLKEVLKERCAALRGRAAVRVR